MVVKQVFDHSLRAYGKRFLSGLKASNRYSEGYLASLETTVAMASLYAEEQGWPDVQENTTEHLEEYLSYLQDRVRWFGERTYAEPKKLSKGHINAQYRRLHRFFSWLVERGYAAENPLSHIKTPSLDEKTVPWHHSRCLLGGIRGQQRFQQAPLGIGQIGGIHSSVHTQS